MRILYHVTLSPFSRKVRLVLAEKGLEFTLKIEKTWERRPEFLALNPAGEVPVLIEPEGAVDPRIRQSRSAEGHPDPILQRRVSPLSRR